MRLFYLFILLFISMNSLRAKEGINLLDNKTVVATIYDQSITYDQVSVSQNSNKKNKSITEYNNLMKKVISIIREKKVQDLKKGISKNDIETERERLSLKFKNVNTFKDPKLAKDAIERYKLLDVWFHNNKKGELLYKNKFSKRIPKVQWENLKKSVDEEKLKKFKSITKGKPENFHKFVYDEIKGNLSELAKQNLLQKRIENVLPSSLKKLQHSEYLKEELSNLEILRYDILPIHITEK